jgi:hypothetical protein
MKITVEHYDEKVSIETKHDDVDFEEFMGLVERITHTIGYHPDTIKKWFNEN